MRSCAGWDCPPLPGPQPPALPLQGLVIWCLALLCAACNHGRAASSPLIPTRTPRPTAGATAGALATLSLSGSGAAGTAGDALVSWDYRKTAAAQERRRTSFRSLKEAIHAAQDGDRIILRRGTHNGMGWVLQGGAAQEHPRARHGYPRVNSTPSYLLLPAACAGRLSMWTSGC